MVHAARNHVPQVTGRLLRRTRGHPGEVEIEHAVGAALGTRRGAGVQAGKQLAPPRPLQEVPVVAQHGQPEAFAKTAGAKEKQEWCRPLLQDPQEASLVHVGIAAVAELAEVGDAIWRTGEQPARRSGHGASIGEGVGIAKVYRGAGAAHGPSVAEMA